MVCGQKILGYQFLGGILDFPRRFALCAQVDVRKSLVVIPYEYDLRILTCINRACGTRYLLSAWQSRVKMSIGTDGRLVFACTTLSAGIEHASPVFFEGKGETALTAIVRKRLAFLGIRAVQVAHVVALVTEPHFSVRVNGGINLQFRSQELT